MAQSLPPFLPDDSMVALADVDALSIAPDILRSLTPQKTAAGDVTYRPKGVIVRDASHSFRIHQNTEHGAALVGYRVDVKIMRDPISDMEASMCIDADNKAKANKANKVATQEASVKALADKVRNETIELAEARAAAKIAQTVNGQSDALLGKLLDRIVPGAAARQ